MSPAQQLHAGCIMHALRLFTLHSPKIFQLSALSALSPLSPISKICWCCAPEADATASATMNVSELLSSGPTSSGSGSGSGAAAIATGRSACAHR